MTNFDFFLPNEEATAYFASDLARALEQGDIITLSGELGAGKSTLARALIRVLAHDDSLEVPSPTFTLVQHYEDLSLPVLHADLYRIGDEEEIEELGFSEALQDGVIVVEWPERAQRLCDKAAMEIALIHEGQGRRVKIRAHKTAAERLQHSFFVRAFLQKNGRGDVKRQYLTGDASPRSYEILYGHNKTEILMHALSLEAPEKAGQSYARKAHLAHDIRQFIAVDRLLCENGFLAPAILAADFDNGLFIIQDLGQDSIVDCHNVPIQQRYCVSVDVLVMLHQKKWPTKKSWPDMTVALYHYDDEAFYVEAALLLDWYLPYMTGKPCDDGVRAMFHQAWAPFLQYIQKTETTLVLRDYHSPNILWQDNHSGDNGSGAKTIGLIDFQDAVIGPTAYDVVSLAQDARVDVDLKLEQMLLERYCAGRRRVDASFHCNDFKMAYAIMGAQRASKILGIFVRLDQRDNKPQYLKHLPRVQDYLQRNLMHPALADLKQCYQQLGLLEF